MKNYLTNIELAQQAVVFSWLLLVLLLLLALFTLFTPSGNVEIRFSYIIIIIISEIMYIVFIGRRFFFYYDTFAFRDQNPGGSLNFWERLKEGGSLEIRFKYPDITFWERLTMKEELNLNAFVSLMFIFLFTIMFIGILRTKICAEFSKREKIVFSVLGIVGMAITLICAFEGVFAICHFLYLFLDFCWSFIVGFWKALPALLVFALIICGGGSGIPKVPPRNGDGDE